MAKELTDDELNLRRKARRRLVGAFTLTLAVVVLLPMVLDKEPAPGGNDIDLSIPSPDKVGEFVPGVAVSEIADTPPPVTSTVVTTSVPLATAMITSPAQEPVEIRKSAPVHKPKEVKSAEKPAAEGYVAQVGAYTNPEAAKQELGKLKQWNFNKAYTEKSGDTIRVRVGPYLDREKAERVGKMLEKHGWKPVILSIK